MKYIETSSVRSILMGLIQRPCLEVAGPGLKPGQRIVWVSESHVTEEPSFSLKAVIVDDEDQDR